MKKSRRKPAADISDAEKMIRAAAEAELRAADVEYNAFAARTARDLIALGIKHKASVTEALWLLETIVFHVLAAMRNQLNPGDELDIMKTMRGNIRDRFAKQRRAEAERLATPTVASDPQGSA